MTSTFLDSVPYHSISLSQTSSIEDKHSVCDYIRITYIIINGKEPGNSASARKKQFRKITEDYTNIHTVIVNTT